MKLKVISIILVLTMSTIGVLSFVSAVSVDHTVQHLCPIATIMSSDCPQAQNLLAFASHHLSGMQNTAQSLINSSSIFLVLFLFLVVARSLNNTVFDKRVYSHKLSIVQSDIPSYIKEMLSWFVLRNKGDYYAFFWVRVRA